MSVRTYFDGVNRWEVSFFFPWLRTGFPGLADSRETRHGSRCDSELAADQTHRRLGWCPV